MCADGLVAAGFRLFLEGMARGPRATAPLGPIALPLEVGTNSPQLRSAPQLLPAINQPWPWRPTSCLLSRPVKARDHQSGWLAAGCVSSPLPPRLPPRPRCLCYSARLPLLLTTRPPTPIDSALPLSPSPNLTRPMGVPPVSPGGSVGYDCSFKILLIGDSGVGKSSLLLSFVAAAHLDDDIAPTIGVDFKIKFLTVGGKKLKLTIWDTAGQERFRTITSSYYRGAQGIILVYDVAKRESFTNLGDVWTKEIDLNSSNKDCIKMLVGNKVDKDDERTVTREEGLAFAQESGCLFLESSAKTRENVENCFEELVLKILEVPSLLEEGSSSVVKRNILKQQQESHAKYGGKCCQ